MQKQHYYWLDALRFIAAFLVLFGHTRIDFFMMWGDLPSAYHTVPTFVFYTLGRLGHEAVIIFFVLSGFLVGGQGLERIHEDNFNVISYSIDRFSRIFPPLVMAVLFYFVTCKIIGTEFNYLCALGNLFSLQGVCCESLVSPFWSLSYEVWFYVAIAGIGLVFAKEHNKKVFGLLLTIIVAVIFMSGLSFHYFALWMIGAAAYITRPQRRNELCLIGSLIGVFIGIFLWQISADSYSINSSFKIENTKLIELFLALMIGILLQQLILCEPRHRFARFIEQKLGYLAKFSYTLYLSHRIVLLLIFAYVFQMHQAIPDAKGLLQYGLLLLITMSFCWCLYLISERYTPQIKKFLKSELKLHKM